MPTPLAQAIRNAIEAERAAARFYDALVGKADGAEARAFLRAMAEAERGHADELVRMAERLAAGELPARADTDVHGIETVPCWPDASGIDLAEAIELAIDAEQSASLYYDALADCSQGEVAQFFRRLVALEDGHAETLRATLQRG